MIAYLQNLPSGLLFLLVILVSVCIGSFLNMLVYRLPRMLQHKEGFSLAWPGSFCPTCRQPLSWYDNLPVVSYLYLKGRCRQCFNRIPKRYLWLEIGTLVASIIVYLQCGRTDAMLAILLLTWWLIAMSMIDLDHFILPDELTLSLLWIGLLLNIQGLFVPLVSAVTGAATSYVFLWAINRLYLLLRQRDGMGQGDWKLLAALGAWFGLVGALYILAIAAVLGAVVGLIAILMKKANYETPLPFGPFLCLATWGWALFGRVF